MNDDQDPNELWSTALAAMVAGCSQKTITNAMDDGRIPAIEIYGPAGDGEAKVVMRVVRAKDVYEFEAKPVGRPRADVEEE